MSQLTKSYSLQMRFALPSAPHRQWSSPPTSKMKSPNLIGTIWTSFCNYWVKFEFNGKSNLKVQNTSSQRVPGAIRWNSLNDENYLFENFDRKLKPSWFNRPRSWPFQKQCFRQMGVRFRCVGFWWGNDAIRKFCWWANGRWIPADSVKILGKW